MKIFISHASEDKDFAHPLAKLLSGLSEFEVWYDEFSLDVGDSLLGKINEGLVRCDFGIVILSSHFFRKKWTRDELDGLFALEDQNRKVILPVWRGVSKTDVTAFSPILAGRLAAQAESGVERVVEQIRLAIANSNRTRELAQPNLAACAARKLGLMIDEKNHAFGLAHTEEGVALVVKAIKEMREFCEGLAVPPGLIIEIIKNPMMYSSEEDFYVRLRGIVMEVGMVGLYMNSTRTAQLIAKIGKRDHFRRLTSHHELTFLPRFRFEKRIVWLKDGQTEERTSTQLAEILACELFREVESKTMSEFSEY